MEKNYQAKEAEEKWKKIWGDIGIYKFDLQSDKMTYSVDTPPPYVNSDSLHLGHAMSYVQAEIIVRFKRMLGYNIFYPMGFDDNGLPTERFVEDKYKIDKAEISRSEFIDLCIKETEKGAINYRKLWESLAIGVDWNLTYNTIGPLAQRVSQKSFIELFKQGLIYNQESPTFWCPSCQTALAQADLEDKEAKGKMYYIKFKIESGSELIIATTRPELLPACVALYVNPEDERYGKYIGKKAIVPVFNLEIPICGDQEVDPKLGTGAMMVCTWGDADDVRRWRIDKLGTRIVVGSNGRLGELAGEFQGLKINAARLAIIEKLKRTNELLREEDIIHSKNVHERCGTPIEFISSRQWFIKVIDAKERLMQLGKELNWYPESMKIRYDDWASNLKWDWCISRDRFYGVPFPLWRCDDCGYVILPGLEDLPIDPREFSPKNSVCPKCGSKNISGEKQVMDTWMTSSLSPLINAKWSERENLMAKIYPADLRVQAFEIIRTWLFYTVVKSWYHTESLPWKSVMISGWGLDKNGKKMSKSKGNFVSIDAAIEQYSADAVRWWATGSALGNNLRVSEVDLQSGRKLTNKLWNVARFIKPLISDFNQPNQKHSYVPEVINFSDRWILAELQETVKDCTKALEECNFNKARIILDKFFWLKYCDNYLELCKDRTWKPEKYDKEQILSLKYSLWLSMNTLLKLFAPFIPFATEEIFHVLFEKPERESIHVAKWPEPLPGFQNDGLLIYSSKFLEIISKIRHYKGILAKNLRYEISSLTLISTDPMVELSALDLLGLSGAKKLSTDLNEGGQRYDVKETIVMLA